MILLKLLILANNFENETERFGEHFEEVEKKSLADSLIEVNGETEILIDGENIEQWDALYINPEPEAFNYSRVLLEAVSRKQISCNLNPSSIFLLDKKPYLFSILSENGINIPKTVAVSTEKGLTEINQDLDFPLIARKYTSFEISETQVFEEFDSLKSFVDLSEHGQDIVTIQEKLEEGEVFDILYVNGYMISLKLEEEPWEKERHEKISKKYHSISQEKKDTVKEALAPIGVEICQVRIKGDMIIDIANRPNLEEFRKKSGKNVYGRIAEELKRG